MIRAACWLACVLLVPWSLGLSSEPRDTMAGDIERAVNASMAREEIPGAVVLVLRKDEVILRQAYGHRRKAPEPTLMTEDTVFDLASLTKPLATALAILLLIEDGKLDVKDLLAKHLVAFARKETDTITLEQLLLHTSGFIPDNPIADYRDGPEKAWERLHALKPIAPPGTRFQYSDVNFLLLGKIVEKVSGSSLDAFTRKRIYEPLGLRATGFLPGSDLRKRAAPTEQREGRWMIGDVHDPRAYLLGGVAGHAGLFSTADDLAIIARMLLNEGKHEGKVLFRPESIRFLTAPRQVPGPKGPGLRTYGWDMATSFSTNRGRLFPKGVSYGHTGFTGTSIWLDPQSRSAVIFLSNRVHPNGKGDVRALRGEVATIAARGLIRND